ncbi:Protein of uncharacterised function with HXXEE motif protein [uncultured archaeon]|nr:Protein of uncharacterised function with HXXEE motif protein [uncultured archaeon]
MTPLKFLRRHWHDIGIFSAVAAGAYLISAWNELVFLQKLLILNFIAVLIHQFEEYSWPGGFPAIANKVFMPSLKLDRFLNPLNQNSSMVANLIFAYGFFLLPVFFPNVIWLGLAPVLVGFVQFIGHAIYVNLKLKSFYSPGVASIIFGWIPIGVVYIYYIQANSMVNLWDWLLAVVWAAVSMLLIFYIIEQKLLGSKNSPYPFDPDEMKRFDVEKKLELARR